MTPSPSITERLQAEAKKGGPHSSELTATIAKLDSYSRAPSTRKQADRIGAILTPVVLRALGDAFLALREEEIAAPPSLVYGPEFRQADYVLAGLLLASATPDLAEAALPVLERVRDLVPRMLPKQAEHVQYLIGLYPESPLAPELADAARLRLVQEPATLAATWAASIGLDLPATYWSLYLVVPADLEAGRIDASLVMSLDNTPGSETRWSIRIGAMNSDELGGNRRSSYTGGYARTGRRASIEGHVEPASAPEELPRVLRDLEVAHPEVTWDRAGLKVSGSPGRLISPTKKKRLIGWLAEG